MSGIDREAPRRRPQRTRDGWQRWSELLFVHWPVAADAIQALLPQGLEIDTFQGQAYVGLVPFAMSGVRPWWLPRPFARDFLELNLRTYVVHRGRPGVWFFSLEAADDLAVIAARVGWSLPYHHARMSMTQRDGQYHYRSQRNGMLGGPGFEARYRPTGAQQTAIPGSLEFFLLERYLLFSEQGGQLQLGQVHHPPYPFQTAQVESLREELIEAAGLPGTGGAPPPLAHWSPGVEVDIFGLVPA